MVRPTDNLDSVRRAFAAQPDREFNVPVIPYRRVSTDQPDELVNAIRARRGGRLLNLDRMLLHSPPFADGWNHFLGKIRTELSLPSKFRELAICYVAVLNGADYEFAQHGPEFIKAGGTREQLGTLRSEHPDDAFKSAFSAAEQAVLQLTRDMTSSIEVAEPTMAAIKTALETERQVMELVGIIAAYNMVSRYLVALGIEPEDADPVDGIRSGEL